MGMHVQSILSSEESPACQIRPTTTRSTARNSQFDRSALKRLLSQKITGVNAAHTHASTNAITIGAVGDIRKPNPRGSRTRFTEDKTARKVQNAKIRASSRVLSLHRG